MPLPLFSKGMYMSWRKVSHVILCGGAAMGKGAFIKLKGRPAWDRLPKYAIIKEGKREYITREAFEDNLWMAKHEPRSFRSFRHSNMDRMFMVRAERRTGRSEAAKND